MAVVVEVAAAGVVGVGVGKWVRKMLIVVIAAAEVVAAAFAEPVTGYIGVVEIATEIEVEIDRIAVVGCSD